MQRLNALIDRMWRYGSRPCLEEDAAVYTYTDLLARCARMDEELQRMRIRPGSVLALQADYSLTATALLLAALTRACVVALIPRDRNVRTYVEDACADDLFKIDAEGKVSRERIGGPCDNPLLVKLRSRGEGGIVLFTSGSTGRPKAALQSTERFLSKFDKPGRVFRTLGFLLFDHIAGLDTLFYTLSSGGTLIVTRRREPDHIAALIESHRVEVLPVSPSFLRLFCLADASHSRDLSSLKVITYGSEPMDARTLALMNECFPNVQISQKYGTTETGSPRTVSRGNESLWLKLAAQGGLETKVVEGVLWLRGESTILGYLNAPSPIDAEGWYCTGDLVDVDGEWLRFRGRAADVINVGGENVSPAEVEQAILELDFVRAAVVEGEKHVLLGQIVTARVALSGEADVHDAAKGIRRYCSGRLAPYKVPVKIQIVDEELIGGRQKKMRSVAAATRH
jgi:acyl-CoA synthetase (AMP-forming)/AMP-acid ligase II